MIGVLGGMGPLATADFFGKVIALAGSARDEDHVPLLIQSDPRIPPRPPAILDNAASPLPGLLAGRDRLVAAGATALAMPCNTAHHWFDRLVDGCPVPFLNIVDAACTALGKSLHEGARVGLLATRATLASGIYDRALAAHGWQLLTPDDRLMEAAVLPAIADVKCGDVAAAAARIREAVATLQSGGAEAVVLACTELPIALQAAGAGVPVRCIDTTLELARACVLHWRRTAAG